MSIYPQSFFDIGEIIMRPIMYICFSNFSGYAFAARNYIHALHRSGLDVGLYPLDDARILKMVDPNHWLLYTDLRNKKITPDTILVYHCIPTMQRRVKTKGNVTIGFCIFEGSEIPSLWMKYLNCNTAVVTASEFNEVALSHLEKPLHRIPHCLDFDIYTPNCPKHKEYDVFTFLFIGTWKNRKGISELLQAWMEEFGSDTSVQLLLKTETRRAQSFIYPKYGKVKNIQFISNKFPDEKMPSFIRSADCIVLPTLGEGAGLVGLQAMAVGVPVIITNFSGVKEYANEQTATLIEPEGIRTIENLDSYVQFQGCTWPFVSVPGIRKAMRQVKDDYEAAQTKAKFAYSYVKDRFNYQVTADKFKTMMEKI